MSGLGAVYSRRAHPNVDSPIVTPVAGTPRFIVSLVTAILLFSSFTLLAQEEDQFDPIAASAELDDVNKQLDANEIEPDFLASARALTVQIGASASACVAQYRAGGHGHRTH